jgi:hypothetical protein
MEYEKEPAGGWAYDADEGGGHPMDGPAERAMGSIHTPERPAERVWRETGERLGISMVPRAGTAWSDPNLKLGPDGGCGVLLGLVEAMRVLPAVGKDQVHDGSKSKGDGPSTGTWNYRSADQVVSAVGPALAKAGVVFLPTLEQETPIQLGSQDGWRLAMTYRFFGTDGSSLSFRMVAHSVGRTAYTIGAAYSYAMKYALSQALCLPFDDERMDMESPSSHGATGGPWWQDGGWGDEGAHTEARSAFLARVQALDDETKGRAKVALAQVRDQQLYGAGGGRTPLGAPLWTPTKLDDPTGPGMFPARLSVAALEAAGRVVDEVTGVAGDGAPAEPEFDVDGDGQGSSDETAKPEPVAEKPARTGRGSRKAQEAPEPAQGTETAGEPVAAQDGAAGAAQGKPAGTALTAEQIKTNRGALGRSLLALKGEWAARAEAALTDAGCWPFDVLTTREQFDAATAVLIPVLQDAGVMPKGDA